MEVKTDFLVIGSGVAGLSFALKVSPWGKVAVVTKREFEESNTKYAQGGIASVWSQEDSFDAHIQDTLVAGDGLCHPDVVEMVVKNGPDRIRDLVSWGVNFTLWDKDKTKYDLAREGGHSKRRIIHAADLTGEEVEKTLAKRVKRNSNITTYENLIAINLIMREGECWGAYV
ncbi:MAG: FAD-dependent oxidoreductase, partial [Elusimicrobia bacterium]